MSQATRNQRQRRPHKKLLSLGVVLLVVILSTAICSKQSGHEYTRTHDTIAHQILDLEKRSGFEVIDAHYQVLDDLIDKIVDSIAQKLLKEKALNRRVAIEQLREKQYSKNDALVLLQTVNTSLIENNFAHRNAHLLKVTLTSQELDADILRLVVSEHERLRSRESIQEFDLSGYIGDSERREQIRTFLKANCDKIQHFYEHPNEDYFYTDCYNTTAIYLSLADVLDLPLRSVNAPNHAFVRWHFSETEYLDWEATRGEPLDDTAYMKQGRLAPEHAAVKNGVYLRSLKRSENLGMRHILIGNLMLRAGTAHQQQGVCEKAKARYKKALEHFSEALQKNPRFTVVHNNIGIAYEYLADAARTARADQLSHEYYEQAIRSYHKAALASPDGVEVERRAKSLRAKMSRELRRRDSR